MNRIIGVITARMGSTRLPGKVLQRVAGKSLFAHHIERMKNVKGLDGVFLATSEDPRNKELIREAEKYGCGWYAGAEQDVVDRHIKLCERENADAVIRVTGDCPLFDFRSASHFVEEFKKEYRDYIYVSNMTLICGTLSELVSYKALLEVHKHYRGPAITMYIKEHIDDFNTLEIKIEQDLCRPEYRLTVDEPPDLMVITRIYEALYKGNLLNLHDVYIWLDDNPQVAELNMHVGTKGCNQLAANLLDTILYSIVPSGNKFVILDEQKRKISPIKFAKELKILFPEMKDLFE